MEPSGQLQQIRSSYLPASLGIDFWAPEKVYKYGLRLHRLAVSILGLLKSFKIPTLLTPLSTTIPNPFF
jgi:hypothetical protein